MAQGRPLVLLVLGLWVLLGPIAMAFQDCDGVCEAPCGTLCAVASAAPDETLLEPARDPAPPARPGLPGASSRVLEPPPKSFPLSA